jgi:hypothetical protein
LPRSSDRTCVLANQGLLQRGFVRALDLAGLDGAPRQAETAQLITPRAAQRGPQRTSAQVSD